jgi:PhnB protein
MRLPQNDASHAGAGTSVGCSVAPMLSVRNGARAVEFYKLAFGAIEVYRIEDPGGSVVSRLSGDGAEFWLADESPEHHNFSSRRRSPPADVPPNTRPT